MTNTFPAVISHNAGRLDAFSEWAQPDLLLDYSRVGTSVNDQRGYCPNTFIEPLELLRLKAESADPTGLAGYECKVTPRLNNAGSFVFLAASVLTALNPAAHISHSYNHTPAQPRQNSVGWGAYGNYVIESATAGIAVGDLAPRLEELRSIADDEDIAISESSFSDLSVLLKTANFQVLPSLFLMDSGNLKVSWRHSIEKHASFELLGSGKCTPILFSKDGDGINNHLHGVVSLSMIPKLLKATGLDEWILSA